MATSVVKGLVAGVLIAAAGTAAAPARALAEPEVPTPTFVPAPSDHQPGSSEYVPPSDNQPRPAAVVDTLPGFITMDRTGTSSFAGMQLGFVKIDDTSLSDGFLMRINPYGQYMFPNRQVGVFGQLSLAHAFDFTGADATGFGNIEMGGLYLPMSDSRLILRASLALPTSSSDDLGDVFSNLFTQYERLTDVVLVAPEYTTLRLSASTVQQMDAFFLRADGGFDLVFSKPGTADGAAWAFFRANVAGGIRTDAVDFALELVNIAALGGDNLDGITERFQHTAAIGARTRGEDQFHLGMVFPLDENTRGELWILSLGYMRAFN